MDYLNEMVNKSVRLSSPYERPLPKAEDIYTDIYPASYRSIYEINKKIEKSIALYKGPNENVKVMDLPAGTIIQCDGHFTTGKNCKWLFIETMVNGSKFTGYISTNDI